MTLHPPANFDAYHMRRDWTAKRNAEKDPTRRGAINTLLEMIAKHEEALRDGDHKRAAEIKAGMTEWAEQLQST